MSDDPLPDPPATPPPPTEGPTLTPDFAVRGVTLTPRPPVADMRKPPRPQPGFWWSLVWCVGLFLFTQIPAAVVGVAVAVFVLFFMPEAFSPEGSSRAPLIDSASVLTSPLGSLLAAVSLSVDKTLLLITCFLVLRLAVGPDWSRKIGRASCRERV